MKEEIEVVMIGTNKEVQTNLHLLISHETNSLSKSYLRDSSDITNMNFVVCKPQELYFISNEEIQIDDWFIRLFDNVILKANSQTDHKIYDCRKIIATTNTSLLITPYEWKAEDVDKIRTKFLQPSQEFIKEYIDRFNEGSPITKVWVEYEGLQDYESVSIGEETVKLPIESYLTKLKVTSKNEISITVDKDYTVKWKVQLPKLIDSKSTLKQLCTENSDLRNEVKTFLETLHFHGYIDHDISKLNDLIEYI